MEEEVKKHSSFKIKCDWKFVMVLIVLIIGMCGALALLKYLYLPTNNPRTLEHWIYFIMKCLIGIIALELAIVYYAPEIRLPKFLYLIYILGGILIVLTIASTPTFHSGAYRDQIGTVNNLDTPLNNLSDVSRIRTVDESTAINLASKKLGEISGLGSHCEIKKAFIQLYKGDLVWVLPVYHKSIVKYLNNSDGTPAYVIVSATNSGDVRFVQQLGENPVRVKYTDSLYTTKVNIERYLYSQGIRDNYDYASFEIDEDGVPYWVVTYTSPTIIMSGYEPTKVIVCNALTGSYTEFAIDEVPDWVDRIYSEDLVIKQLDNNGKYIHGMWNFLTAKKEVTETNENTTNFVIGDDGNTYWSTSISSSGADESAIGYALINTRTKEAFYYKQAGTTESGAMKSAQGKVQEKGYVASYPTLYTIKDVPTYVMSLKDTSGLVKAYAFVNLTDVNVVVVEDTIQRAYTSYFKLLEENGTMPEVDTEDLPINLGIITAIEPVVVDGNTVYYMKFKGRPQVYQATIDLSYELPFLKEGDSVVYKIEDSLNILDLRVLDK